MSQKSKITLEDIANKVGVSTTTVSRVLTGQSNRYRISDRTRELVSNTASELGYLPNQLARGLRTKRTNTIGLIIPDISNPFFSTIARNIEILARKVGISIILSDSQEDTQLEIESLRILQARNVDGLIICPVGEESAHLLNIVRNGLPVVIVDRYFPDINCPHVVSDNYQGALDAVSHFFEMEHKRVAFIQGRVNTSVNNDRVRGYRDAHKLHNIPVDESLIVGDSFGKRNGYSSAKILLKKNPPPTAIFLASNLISLGAMSAIHEENLKIPDDISIIAFDDQPYSDYLATPMTTVNQQTAEAGEISFKLLLSQIEDEQYKSVERIVLPTTLIFRKSVKRLQ